MALGIGIVNGLLVPVFGGNSFIMTLGMATILTGLEYAFTSQAVVFQGIPQGYVDLGAKSLFGLNNQVWIALGVALILWILLDATELGRFMYAIGGNQEAARLSGIRTRLLRTIGFMIVATTAAMVGILISAAGAGYTPNAGQYLLLPAFAGAFLGAACFRPGRVQHPGHRRRRALPRHDPNGPDAAQSPDLPDQPRPGRDPDRRRPPQHGGGAARVTDLPPESPPPALAPTALGAHAAEAVGTRQEPFIVMRGLVKRYPGVVALDHADGVIVPGAVVGLLGKNGAGKSTLIKILAGVVQPDEGEILIDGEPCDSTARSTPRDAGLAFVHQELADVPNLTVAENVELGLGYPKLAGAFVKRRALRRKSRGGARAARRPASTRSASSARSRSRSGGWS